MSATTRLLFLAGKYVTTCLPTYLLQDWTRTRLFEKTAFNL